MWEEQKIIQNFIFQFLYMRLHTTSMHTIYQSSEMPYD